VAGARSYRAFRTPGAAKDGVARIEALRAGLLPFRLSKFQPLLAARFAREVIGRPFPDFEGTARLARWALGT
jgi:hypothetical protein